MKEGSVTKSLSRFVRSLKKEQYVYAFNSSIFDTCVVILFKIYLNCKNMVTNSFSINSLPN